MRRPGVSLDDFDKFLKSTEHLLSYNCDGTGVVVAMARDLLHKLALLVLTSFPLSCAAQQSALDLDGKSVNPLKANGGQPVVLVFVRKDCPISARYAPVIQRISEEHHKDARFYLVFPDKTESSVDIRKYLHEFRYSISGLRDPDHALVKETDAKVTPEAAVFDAKGGLVYHGRIDNLYESFGRSRSAPTTHELEDAVQAALAGRTPANKTTTAVGCYISDLQ
jgi:thiol-disulfide isomerase/thioredoxin